VRTASIDERELKTRVAEVLNRWPAAGLAVGVVRTGSLEWFYGHGVADTGTDAPVTEDTVFRIASITKTFTAIAVMQLWEQGLVDLDAPASDYRRAYRLIPAKASSRPATLRHLLTHTAGVRAVRRPSDCPTEPAGQRGRPSRDERGRAGEDGEAEHRRGQEREWEVDEEPGLNLIYVHLNRAIRARDLNAIYVTGPGHGGPGIHPASTSGSTTRRTARSSRVRSS
jgi:CubicO group peptidase (beta-lactamase class C family)